MPQLGVSVDEGTIAEWRYEPGERVAADEVLAEISTDKVETELACPVDGTLLEILADVGETVQVGATIARIATDPGSEAAHPHSGDSEKGPEPNDVGAVQDTGRNSRREAASVDRPATVGPREDGRRYSPLVRRMAAAHEIELDRIEGSGIRGRVTKRDLTAHLQTAGEGSGEASESPQASSPDGRELRPLSEMRRTIAERMRASRATAAHCHSWIEVDMARVEDRRSSMQLSPLPFVAQATVEALGAHPEVNAWLEGEALTLHGEVNLGVAVSLGAEGLIVPVIHDAGSLSIEGLSRKIKDLARRARGKRLKPDDVQGATFTITNQGIFGTYMSAPIINLPQVGILDLQAITKRVVVVEDEEGGDAIRIRPMTVLGLSWDHRALDGAQAGAFLKEVRDQLESWPLE